MPQLTFTIASKLEEAGFKDAADHLRSLDKGQQEAHESADGLKEGYADLKSELLGFASVVGVLEFFKSSIEAATELQEQESLLASKVESTGVSYEKVKPQVDAFTEALAQQTRFQKGESLNALGNMVDRTRDLGTAERLLTDAMGFAVAKHMDLATAGERLAAIAEHQQRAMSLTGRELGLNNKEMKDSDLILRVLHERYGDLATSETSAAKTFKQFGNTIHDVKEEIGGGLLPGIEMMVRFFGALAVTAIQVGKVVSDVFIALVMRGAEMARLVADLAPWNWKHLKGDARELKENLKMTWDEMAEDFKKGVDAWMKNAKGIPDALNPHKNGVQEMLDETRGLIDQLNASSVKNDIDALEKKKAAILAEGELKKAQIAEQLGMLKESQANIAAAQTAQHAETLRQVDAVNREIVTKEDEKNVAIATANLSERTNADDIFFYKMSLLEQEREALIHQKEFKLGNEEELKRRLAAIDRAEENLKIAKNKQIQDAMTNSLHGISVATSKFVQGDKGAWKDWGNSVVQTAVDVAGKQLLASKATAMGVALSKGWAGLPELAWLTGEFAVVEGLLGAAGGIASNVINGGPSGGAGGGGAFPSFSESPATVSSNSAGSGSAGNKMNLTVVVDHLYGDATYIDMLALKISDRIERADVRFIATSVK